MKTKKQRFSYLIVFVLLLVTACVPPWSGYASSDKATTTVHTGEVDTEQVVQTVLAQVESRLATQQNAIPAAYYGASLSGATDEARNLEATLTHLYRQANPSVVYVIVSSNSSGSGFVYDADGHIITNYHVVAGGKRYEVVFASGERRWARLIGSDVDGDLAVLKVDALFCAMKSLCKCS